MNEDKLLFEEIIGVPVYTQSEDYLGRVDKVVCEPNTQRALQYWVRDSHWFRRWLGKKLIIHRSQVVSLTKEKMVVFDATVKGWQAGQIDLAPVSGGE